MSILLTVALLLQSDDIGKLTEALGSDQIEEREAAEKKLVELGEKAEPALMKAAEGSGEVAARAKAALKKIASARAAAKKFKYSQWESWDVFEVGSTVDFDVATAGMTMRMSRTLDTKGAERILVKNKTTIYMAGSEIDSPPHDEQVTKTEMPAECPLCKKAAAEHKDEGEWGGEALTIGDREIQCTTYVVPERLCNGTPSPRTKMWYSREVPGFMVKMQTDQMTMTATKFTAKPVKK